MIYNTLGKTDITVAAIAMGCWAIVGDETWGPQDEELAIATIRSALDAGINFFDTAEIYGNGYSEQLLAKALEDHRQNAIIASKVSTSHLAKKDVIQSCEQSLKNLNTDYIDLYQIHWPSRKVPFEETYRALQQLQEQGKIRAIGLSNFGRLDLTEFLKIGHGETNQLPYSLLWRAIEYDIIQHCLENKIGVLCYSPLALGLLTGKFSSADQIPDGRTRTRHFSSNRSLVRHGEEGCEFELFEALDKIRHICEEINQPMGQVALAWLVQQPAVTSVLAGARNPEQVKSNAQAAALTLGKNVVNELNQATQVVKQKLGDNPDMWQAESRFR